MGIPLKKGPVHEGAGVSLVRVADDITDPFLPGAGFPFESRGESGTAAATQAAAGGPLTAGRVAVQIPRLVRNTLVGLG